MPRTKTVAIPDDVRDVLAQATFEPRALILNGTLDKALYAKVDKVIKAAGGKWNRGMACHQFADEAAVQTLKDAVAGEAEIVDVKKSLEQFYTPEALARKMLDRLDMGEREGLILLEPSAGRGAIVNVALTYGATVVAVEIDPANCAALRARQDQPLGDNLTVIEGDFAEIAKVTPEGFDRVAMNPPFSNGQDIEHVRLAYDRLKPGGKMVAIMGESAFFQTYARAAAFRNWIGGIEGAEHIALPEGSFKESGTMVNTRMLYLPKPAVQVRHRVRRPA